MISIIVPVFNEEATIPIFYDEICKYMSLFKQKHKQDMNVLFVDDGSKDQTLSVIKKISKEDDRISFVSFTRNFGKEAAIYAGLKKAKGDFVALMDVDLQDPPSLLEDMYLGITTDNYDCVASRRKTRKGEAKIRSLFAKLFYKLINSISETNIVDGARDFRMMTKQMVDSILEISEYNRFSKGIFSWVGFNVKWLEYDNIERCAGSTKWSFTKLLAYSIDGIVDYSTKPLSIAAFLGVLFCILAFIMIVVIIVKTLVWGDPAVGYPSTICLILFVSGIQLLCMGIIGKYLSKTYLETKRRPIYLIKDEDIK